VRYLIPILILITNAHAGQYYGGYGVGVFQKDSKSFADIKLFNIGTQWDLYKLFKQKLEAGVWTDVKFENRRSSGYAAYSVGIRVEPQILYVESFWGAALMTHTDGMLSSNFQFMNDTGIGVQDDAGRFIGISYKHISNAGISYPNLGRDFLSIKMGFSL